LREEGDRLLNGARERGPTSKRREKVKKGEKPTRKGREGAYSNENERVGREEIGDGKGGEAILPPKVLTLENLGGPTVKHILMHFKHKFAPF